MTTERGNDTAKTTDAESRTRPDGSETMNEDVSSGGTNPIAIDYEKITEDLRQARAAAEEATGNVSTTHIGWFYIYVPRADPTQLMGAVIKAGLKASGRTVRLEVFEGADLREIVDAFYRALVRRGGTAGVRLTIELPVNDRRDKGTTIFGRDNGTDGTPPGEQLTVMKRVLRECGWSVAPSADPTHLPDEEVLVLGDLEGDHVYVTVGGHGTNAGPVARG